MPESTLERCNGSGRRPVENVILDTVVGVDPRGTCPLCHRIFRLDFYRLPEHSRPESGVG